MSPLPPYIDDTGHGSISYPVPLQIDGVTSYSFVLEADTTKLQAFIDSQLNAPAGSPYRYTALPFLFHAYLNAEHCTSTTTTIGYLPDRESAFLVPVLQWKKDELLQLPEPKMWVPYLFINQQAGMVTGREVWGYRKSLASIDVPASPQQPDSWSAQTTIFRSFAPTTLGEWAQIVSVRRLNAAAVPTIRANPPELGNRASAQHELFKRAMAEFRGPLASLATEVAGRFLLDTSMPVVNLKQFRDAVDSTRACYQALTDSPIQVTQWRNAGWLDDPFQIEITDCASHRIVDDLGLKATPSGHGSSLVDSHFAIWAEFDFCTEPGRVLWQAT